MRFSKKYLTIAVISGFSMLVFAVTFLTKLIDNQYVVVAYPRISHALRWMTGFVGISIGDCCYLLFSFWVLFSFFRTFLRGYHMEKSLWRTFLLSRLYRCLVFFLVVYISFNLLWGLNYYKSGIEKQWGIELQPYSKTELEQLNAVLIKEANDLRASLSDSFLYQHYSAVDLAYLTTSAYQSAAVTNPLLSYPYPSVKASLFSAPLSYLGISGYYNPFTGEAQVNMQMPDFIQPFTACHEVAHQLGYAKEKEANWIGFLAAIHSNDKRVRYAAAFEMMMYANKNLQAIDTASAANLRRSVSNAVRKDWKMLISFSQSHQSSWEPLMDNLYDWFLRSHQQPEGLISYERVTALLIGYYKQKGVIGRMD